LVIIQNFVAVFCTFSVKSDKTDCPPQLSEYEVAC
jgi:hypothetical protein